MNGDNTELARALGELQGQVAGLQREMTAHRQESRDSTDRLHRRISDSQTALLSKFEENAAAIRAVITGQTACDRDCLRRWLGATESVEYAVSVATGYVTDALAQLDLLEPSDARSSLTALAEFIVRREF